MDTVVTWWVNETRMHHIYKDEESARVAAQTLRQRSDAYEQTSFVPIRVMPFAVYKRMQALEKSGDMRSCTHGLLRLCLRCLPHIDREVPLAIL
jgi:hypothetical protein